MKQRKLTILVWFFCAMVVVLLLIGAIIDYQLTDTPKSTVDTIKKFLEVITNIGSAMIGTLIITRQPRNTIGWLLIVSPVAAALISPLNQFLPRAGADPSQVSPITLFATWMTGWSWWFLIGPLLLIPLLFPTGKLLSPHWRWVIYALVADFGAFIFAVSFMPTLIDVASSLEMRNPLGWLKEETTSLIILVVQILLATIAAFCVAAIFIRYRRAAAIEREQIKWLLYAYGIFLAIFATGFFVVDQIESYGILLNLAFFSIPLAIGVAILRYRLWDIDLIIRRTLQYTAISAVLGLVYFGSVVLLRQVLGGVLGNSSVAIVLSTLLIAALFNPLRRRIQDLIDRRFYRPKYDAEQALSEFHKAARDEVELTKIQTRLVNAVDQTIQPEHVSLWLRKAR